MKQKEFEELYLRHKGEIERFVYYKTPSKSDGDDILQETALAAYLGCGAIRDTASFKAWIFKIAANKCFDYYRKRARLAEVPLEEVSGSIRRGADSTSQIVRDTLETLRERDMQILYLYYISGRPQSWIAQYLGVPIGTVKSRLSTAKQSFRDAYPRAITPLPADTAMQERTGDIIQHTRNKGDITMKCLPTKLYDYTITPSSKEPFSVKWEEVMGWFFVPRLDEKLSWAAYDFPERRMSEYFEIEAIGKASVHGIEGVEFFARESNSPDNLTHRNADVARTFVAQLTDTHCRILSESHMVGDVRMYYTFLDEDEFLGNWGYGEDNCGKEINLAPKGLIKLDGDALTCPADLTELDIIGRYIVSINGVEYDTVCVVDANVYNTGVVGVQYIDREGRTVLWRRYNRDDWHFDRDGLLWSEKLPLNERIAVNGEVYVHWYDCVTSYIL